MSRNPDLEAVLQAQYDLEGANPSEKAARLNAYNELVNHYVEEYNSRLRKTEPKLTRRELVEALDERYREFRKQRELEQLRARGRLR